MKILKKLLVIVIIIIFLIGIDFINIYNGNKPIFAIAEDLDNVNKVYKGLVFDTYNCASYSALQVKFKWTKFSCPEIINKEETINKEDSKSVVKLTLVGDLLFEQPFYDAVSKGDKKEDYFSLVKDYFQEDDLTIGNMEVVIGNENLKSSGTGYNFCAPEYIGHLVNSLDFEILSTANNHAYDRGKEGIESTIDFFSKNTDIMTVGTSKKVSNPEEKVLTINDIKFGFLAYTYGTNQKPSDEDKNLISYYRDPVIKKVTIEYKNKITKEIEELKKVSDVIVVMMHWGTEFTYKPNKEQKEMAKFLNELGVDIIVGSHSHCIQPVEVIGDEHKTLVYYSLGNFASADDDIARTPVGVEEFDNAYQVGLLSTLNVIKENNVINIRDVKTELTINYFDSNMRNFKLVPYKDYDKDLEQSHYRYNKGFTKEFINQMYNQVIDKSYHK